MKKYIFILGIVFFLMPDLSAQKVRYDTLFNVATCVGDDTTLYRSFKLSDGRYFEIDITSLSANTDTIWVANALDTSFAFTVPSSIDAFPLIADKVTYKSIGTGDVKSRVPIWCENWVAKYLVIRWKKGPSGSETGKPVLVY